MNTPLSPPGGPAPQDDPRARAAAENARRMASEMNRRFFANLESFPVQVPPQDLRNDRLLRRLSTAPLLGQERPVLAGIALLARLGHGELGAVYYGLHSRLGIPVAVKILLLELAGQPERLNRFLSEARTAGQVQSPHLVRVRDINEASGYHFLIMEYVPGGSARDCLAEVQAQGAQGLAEADVRALGLASARGLAAAHAHDIIHRDVKPSHVLIPRDPDGTWHFAQAQLTDLALARREDDAGAFTASRATLGTPGFMAYEQIVDARSADKRTDVFGLGATLYALLGGQPPCSANQVALALQGRWQAHVPLAQLRPDVSPGLTAFIEQCLALQPEGRYPDAGAAASALEACPANGAPAPAAAPAEPAAEIATPVEPSAREAAPQMPPSLPEEQAFAPSLPPESSVEAVPPAEAAAALAASRGAAPAAQAAAGSVVVLELASGPSKGAPATPPPEAAASPDGAAPSAPGSAVKPPSLPAEPVEEVLADPAVKPPSLPPEPAEQVAAEREAGEGEGSTESTALPSTPPGARAQLVVITKAGRKSQHTLGRKTSLGRHPTCTIQVLDQKASRKHCEIEEVSGYGFYAEDCGSSNGTLLNGQPLLTRKLIRHGDYLQIGGTFLFFSLQTPATAEGEGGARFLEQVSPELNAWLQQAGATRTFAPASVILREGQQSRSLYVVTEGAAEVVRQSGPEGGEVLLATLGPGACFGEVSLLTGQPATASVRSRSHVTVLMVDRVDLELRLATSVELNRILSRLLAERLGVVMSGLKRPARKGLNGDLATLPACDLLNLLASGRRTGALQIQSLSGSAVIAFREGEPVTASVGEMKGSDALQAILALTEGAFTFVPGHSEEAEPAPGKRVHHGTVIYHLLAKARQQEGQKGGAT